MNDFDISLNNESSLSANPQELVPNSGLEAAGMVTDDSQNSANSSMLPTLEEDILRYEAEELTLSNYQIESKNVSSGGKHISLLGSDSNTGTATGVFNGEAGIYQVNVGFYDENDGVSSVDITVAGKLESFSFDKDLPANRAAAEALTSRITHSEIELQPGDEFKIEAESNSGEFARFDYVEFIPIDSSTDKDTDAGDSIKSPIDKDTDAGDSINSPIDKDTDAGDSINSPIDKDTDAGDSINSPVDAETYYVSPDGSDDNPGTKEKPWKTVNYAVQKDSAVKAGDTILVQPGTYTELITLDKSGNEELGHITLKADGDVTLRDPDPNVGDFREGVIQSANQGHWIIDGFRIENTSWAGIALRDANNMIVQNNHTFETGASGIIVLPESYYEGGEAEVTSKDIKVIDNKIERANWRWAGRGDTRGTQEALSIWGVDGFEVANNIVKEGNREGIDVKTGSRNGSIHNNTVTEVAKISGTPGGYNGGPAIYVDGNRADSFNIDVYNNKVYGNTSEGIVINDEEPGAGDVRDIRVFNNVVYDNGTQGINSGAGIMVGSNVSDVEITNNTLSGNVQSFVIDGSDFFEGDTVSNVVLRNNIFADSGYRHGFIEDAEDVVLDNNLFTDGTNKLFETGDGAKNIQETNNFEVKSVGFSDAEAKDYHLTSNSPAVDAGTNVIPEYLKSDADSKQRKIGKAVDVGSFEFGKSDAIVDDNSVEAYNKGRQEDSEKATIPQDASDDEKIVLRNKFF
ncbi:MAG: right-handed parallel beta-helix repeat-containing protein [Cyanobacteria bacterium J06633_8]